MLLSFSDHILKPALTDPIRLFVIPALGELQNFPYTSLLVCLHKPHEIPSISLLYAVLALEKLGAGELTLWVRV